LVFVVLALVSTGLAAAGPGQPVFTPARQVGEAARAVGFLTEFEGGDLNADGVPDLVVTRINFKTNDTFPLGILEHQPDGKYRDVASEVFAGSVPRTQQGRQIVLADFNGDGRPDIFVADHGNDTPPFPGYPNTLALSQADGKLVDASANLPPESGFSHSAAAADVNGDGAIDLFVGNLCCGDHTPPEILLNDGSGHFTRALDRLPPVDTDTEGGNRYTRAAFVDVNNDRAPDLVLGADDRTAASVVLLNDGTGHFRVRYPLPAKPFGAKSITIAIASANLNGDGFADLVIGSTKGDPFYVGRWIQILVNTRDGTFRDETAMRLPQSDNALTWPYAIRVADVNSDGRDDIGVSLTAGQSEHPPLYVQRGDGTFAASSLPAPSIFAFGDVDRDGHPDVLAATPGNGDTSEAYFFARQLVAPAAPTGVTASRGRFARRVHVAWRRSLDATSYEVRRGTVLAGTTTSTAFDDRRVRPGVVYAYNVVAVNAAGHSAPSVAARGFAKR
jgi:hypothetical protein